jgi:hypothetical protein
MRVCTPQQNSINKISFFNKTGYKGVSVSKGSGKRFRARISYNYKEIVVGYFDSPEEASKARLEALDKIHGEFANKQVKTEFRTIEEARKARKKQRNNKNIGDKHD